MRVVARTIVVGVTLTACGSDGGNVGPPASQLAFTVQPSGITAGQTISPAVQVSIEDASGNLHIRQSTPPPTNTRILYAPPQNPSALREPSWLSRYHPFRVRR